MNAQKTEKSKEGKKPVKKFGPLEMNISYNMKDQDFKITGNVNEVGQKTILEAFLRSQRGRGVDNSKANERDVYDIRFKVDLSYDIINVSSNTGNKGLRDGILMEVYDKLSN